MLQAGLFRPSGCPEVWPEGGRNFDQPERGNVRAFCLERSRNAKLPGKRPGMPGSFLNHLKSYKQLASPGLLVLAC
jgi:hypothetical protein